MDVLEIVGGILLIVASIALIVAIVLQEGGQGGLGALGGESETYIGKNGDRSRNAVLMRITKILAVLFMVVSLALYIISAIGD